VTVHRHRSVVAGGAAVAVVAAAALAAGPGSAQAPAPISLHIVHKVQKSVGFAPAHKPRQGDTVGFGAVVSGDDNGHARIICTEIAAIESVCIVEETLSKGTITAQGLALNGRVDKAPFAITGGTGAYDGARGTAIASDNANATRTDIQITLLP